MRTATCTAAGLTALLLATVSASAAEMVLRDHGGYPVYRVPFYSAVPTRTVTLPAHHDPVKRDKGWKIAYLDVGYIMSNPIFLEEVPARAADAIGQKIAAEITYVVVSGEGVAVHRQPDGKEERLLLKQDDIILVPYGHWIGFANPFNAPFRLMAWGVSLVPEMLDQSGRDLEYVDEQGLRPKEPFVLQYLKYQKAYPAEAIGPVSPQQVAGGSRRPSAVKKGHGFHVYQPAWAMPINMVVLETPPHHYPKRREEGWRDAHLELGGRAINNFIVQEEAPSFKEIGHKHGGDVMFYGLLGKGYIAFRPEIESKEIRTFWGAGDFFVLPRVEGGVWHAHANPTNEQNRLIYTPPAVDDKVLMDPYVGRMFRGYPESEKEDDRDAVWQAIRPPQ